MDPFDLSGPADSVRTYTPEEKQRLTENLLAIELGLHSRDPTRGLPSLEALREFHAALFAGVRDHAGRIRTRDFGSEYLTFGPRRSVHRSEVERQLLSAFEECRRRLRALLDSPDAPNFESEAIWLAIWVHAEIIRIHPFEDGNGRTSRVVMSHILLLLNLVPIPVEASKHEYIDALNRYFVMGNRTVLLDLFLRLYVHPEER